MTPTITILEMLVVITPVTFSFIVVTTDSVVEATSGSTAAKALDPRAKTPPKTASESAVILALLLANRLLIFLVILFNF